MIRVPGAAGTREWRKARAGIVTASCLDKLLTPKTLKASAQAGSYMNVLIAERLLGRPLEDDGSLYMDRGRDLEQEAADHYAFTRGIDLEECGLILRDDRKMGATPDRLVGDSGLLEIKVPAPQTHVGYLRDPASLVAEYKTQLQGEIMATGRAWADVLSFNPSLPEVCVRVFPDAPYRAALDPVLDTFLATMKAEIQGIIDRAPVDPFSDLPFMGTEAGHVCTTGEATCAVCGGEFCYECVAKGSGEDGAFRCAACAPAGVAR